MLKPAQLYADDLIWKFEKTWYNDEYKFYVNDCFYRDVEIAEDTSTQHQFVSLDSNNDLVGYIGYEIDRQTDNVNHLCAINFNHNKVTFGKDLIQAIDDIFMKFSFNKINFNVVVGNPAEAMYDKFIRMCKGRIVGTLRSHVKLVDGQIYDIKMYEITRDDYIRSRHRFFKWED